MQKIAQGFSDLVGNTPLMHVHNYVRKEALEATLLVKLESFNPMSSVKDRVAVAMIGDAEARGLLKEGTVIVEPTSGNTGIGLAAVAASKGYRIILTMPETMSVERRNLLKALGAEIVLTEGSKGMKGAIRKAEELVATQEHAFMPGQFDNLSNPQRHEETTAKEILQDTEGNIDIFVAGIGTGGTITGVGRGLKKADTRIQVVGVEPKSSPYLTEGVAGPHKIQGIGAGFKPSILDDTVIDQMLTIEDKEAYDAAKCLAQTEGILVGVSSGAALAAAAKIARMPQNKGKVIVALLPDTGERYLSTGLFD